MNKFNFSLIALSCTAFLTACSSSSGGADNSEQLRQTETTLTKKLVELNQQVKNAQQQSQNNQSSYNAAKAQAEKAQAEVTALTAQIANLTKELATLKAQQAQATLDQKTAQLETAKQNEQHQQKLKELDAQTQKAAEELAQAKQNLAKAQQDAEAANKATEELKAKEAKAEEERKVAEDRIKQLENLRKDEQARIPLSDKIFGGVNGIMTGFISGAVMDVQSGEASLSSLSSPITRNIRELSIVDNGRIMDITVMKTAGEEDPWTYEAYEDPYNLRKEGNSIQSNSNLKSTAFGVYVDNYTGKQYLYAQGNPTDEKQIPTTGKAEYVGGAVYMKDLYPNERAAMKATVDFDKKAIDIVINKNRNAVPEMSFGGNITGNSFAGEVNGIKTQGGFFGENAKELSGIFTNEADQSRGVYGAIKQE